MTMTATGVCWLHLEHYPSNHVARRGSRLLTPAPARKTTPAAGKKWVVDQEKFELGSANKVWLA